MGTLQHKQVKSQKQHLKILWGRGAEGSRADIWGRGPGAEKNKYPSKTSVLVLNDHFKMNVYFKDICHDHFKIIILK